MIAEKDVHARAELLEVSPSATQDAPELWQRLIHPEDRAATQRLLSDHLEQNWPFSERDL
jgi:hypothetical protein